MKKKAVLPKLIYFFFAALYLCWVLLTYRNVVHMDILTIISTKVKDLYEHNLHARDFVYEPIVPSFVSLLFTFCNALFFHLNTMIDTTVGVFFLTLLGYHYLRNMDSAISPGIQKVLFAFLIGFLVFGLQKWEASLTSFFSFSVFYVLYLCFINYFFIARYIDEDRYIYRQYDIPLLIASYLLIIIEEPSYFYGYLIAVTILLILVRRLNLLNLNKRRWNTIFIVNAVLLFFTVVLTVSLSHYIVHPESNTDLNLSKFFNFFLSNPLWIIKFYLIANSGPFLGEAGNHMELSLFAGLMILAAYAWAVWYVIKNKEKRLLVPIALIFYNIISYGLITIGRYVFNALEYGSSSRYTAFNLSGVLGLTTILFFYVSKARNPKRIIGFSFLAIILAVYLYVDKVQLRISPYRTVAFKEMRTALLTGKNLGVLQDDSATSLKAIEILKKYHLNVYYCQPGGSSGSSHSSSH